MSFKFIFEVRVADDKDEEFIENWHKMSIPIQEYDGAMGTRLHKKQGEEHTYIAIADVVGFSGAYPKPFVAEPQLRNHL